MAAETSKNLVIEFEREDGKNHSITIPDYREDLTDDQIKENAKGIVTANVFAPDGFGLTKVTEAVKVETTKTAILMDEK
ncbi:MAG: DUF2922 domain-containing protein [Eubacterium sp.]